MGKRGPPRTPKPILANRGSHLAVSRGKVEATTPAGSPVKPSGLTANESAVWDATVESLEKIGTLHVTDGAALARYCSLSAQWDVAVAESDVSLMLKLCTPLLRLEQQFGLTPASRAGLAVAPRKTEEETEARYFG